MTKQNKKCVRRYMARKVWGGFCKWFLSPLIVIGGLFGALILLGWVAQRYPLIVGLVGSVWIGGLVMAIVSLFGMMANDLYDEARRECGYDRD